MSTTTFQHPDTKTPVTLPAGLSQTQLLDFPPFNAWLKTLHHSLSTQQTSPQHPFHTDPYTLQSITVQAFDLFGSQRLGFVKLTTSISNSAGEKLPGAVFLRGPSVAMLVVLIPDDVSAGSGSGGGDDGDEEERYVLLTVQPRVAAGSLAFVELPAGMVDDGGSFAGQAAKEIEEELGIVIKEGELVNLSELAMEGEGEQIGEVDGSLLLPKAVYPSAGGCDEYIPIFLHERRVPRAQLGEWSGRLTGLRDEGEKITLKLVEMKDLWKEGARDAKALAAVALWEGLRKEGRI